MLRRPDFYRLLARWRALGLRERLLAYLVVFWFLPVVIGVGVILAIQRQDAQVDAIQHLEVLADSRQAILQDWRESALEHAAEVAGLIVLCSPEMGGQACDLRELLATESLGAAAEISLLDPATARVILSTDPVQEGKIRAGQDYFQSGRNQASLSGIFYDLALDEPAQIASTPVRNQVGEVMGVVAVRLDVCKLDAKVAAHTGLGAAGNVYLVNRDGFLLTSGRYKAGGILRQAIFSEGATRALAGENGWAFYDDYRGVPVLGVYRWLPEADMALLVEMEQSVIFRKQQVVLLTILSLALVFLLAGVGGAVFVSRNASRSLTDLVEQTTRMAAGDLDARVPLRGEGELVRLGRAFNEMAAAVQQRTTDLAALNTIAAATSESLDLDTILDAALQQIVAITGVDGAECHLPDDNGDLALAMTWELDEDFAKVSREFRFPIGGGIPGRAFARRAPVYIPDASADERYWRRDLARAAGYRSLLCVPILGRNGLQGTFMLYCCQTRQFAPEIQALLVTIGKQLAVAIERARLYGEVHRLAITDGLTGLHNRRHFFTLSEREFKRARRYGRLLSAIMLDIDDFKRVNDSYGHAVGDHVLRITAARCLENLRGADILGRYGGEEFAVLLPEIGLEGAYSVAERLRRYVADKPVETARGPVRITTSLGVATLTNECPDLAALIDQADAALYRAKHAGRNLVRLALVRPE